MPSQHALLSASSAHRWMVCPPSVLLSETFEDAPSRYALEGSQAHELCEHKLKLALGIETKDPTATLSFYNEDMNINSDAYASFVMEMLETAKQTCSDPQVLIEQKVNFSRWVPDGFGTADCVIVADASMHVIDYKNGAGIEVSAENNPQMMLYALGAIEAFDGIYDIDEVKMTIFQPRKSNVSTFALSKEELIAWAENELAPKAKQALRGEGEYFAGNHCRFCKAKAQCRTRAEHMLEIAQMEFKNPPLLTDNEVCDVLSRLDEIIAWTTDVRDYALNKALQGHKWPNWKLVEGRSNRKYTDEAAVAKAVSEAGFEPFEQKLLGITAMQKLLGRTRFDELLSEFVIKPKGKPTLVPQDDRRQELNPAQDDFKEN